MCCYLYMVENENMFLEGKIGMSVTVALCLVMLNKWRNNKSLLFTKRRRFFIIIIIRKCRILIILVMLLNGYNCFDSKCAERRTSLLLTSCIPCLIGDNSEHLLQIIQQACLYFQILTAFIKYSELDYIVLLSLILLLFLL